MSQAANRITTINPVENLAHQRLSVLQLAETLGSVSKACRQAGMDRTSFYEWKRRFQTHGLEGLKDLPPVHHYHPQTTPPEVVDKILAASAEYPRWGCVKLSDWLKLQGISVSSPTVQSILIKHGLGSRYERLLNLEERHLSEGFALTPEQVAQIEKANPCFREHHVESASPGDLLCQDTFCFGWLPGVGRVYLQAVVDTYSSYAFGFLHYGNVPVWVVAVLDNDVLPFFRDCKLAVNAVLTDNGQEFCGTSPHPYEIYLELNDIQHRRTRVKTPETNGFLERFKGTVLNEFLRKAFREKFYDSVEDLQRDLDCWLVHYNTERPHRGYRNMGKSPIETINFYLQNARQEG